MTERIWRHRTGEFELGRWTLLMGIVNVTPDSFSDGGDYFDSNRAIEQALRLEAQGADIVDIGGESTKPGSDLVESGTQLDRLLPVFEGLKARIRVPLSVDTTSSEVARRCLMAGASIINDVSALRADPHMATVCADAHAGVILMHMRGSPATMQSDTRYDDLLGEIINCLRDSLVLAETAGIDKDRILTDPGLGFGKSFDQNYQILGGLRRLSGIGVGILVGPSRKGFTGEFNRLPPPQRQYSTAAAVVLSVLNGADVVRVHDVAEMRQVTDIVDRFCEIGSLHER